MNGSIATLQGTKRRRRLMGLQYRAALLECFGKRLKLLRNQKGLSRKKFQEITGIDSRNMSKYESGSREPGLIIMLIMAKGLGVSIRDLLDFKFEFVIERNAHK